MKKKTSILGVITLVMTFLFLSVSFLHAAQTDDEEYQEWLKEKRARQEKSVTPS